MRDEFRQQFNHMKQELKNVREEFQNDYKNVRNDVQEMKQLFMSFMQKQGDSPLPEFHPRSNKDWDGLNKPPLIRPKWLT